MLKEEFAGEGGTGKVPEQMWKSSFRFVRLDETVPCRPHLHLPLICNSPSFDAKALRFVDITTLLFLYNTKIP